MRAFPAQEGGMGVGLRGVLIPCMAVLMREGDPLPGRGLVWGVCVCARACVRASPACGIDTSSVHA